MASLTAGCNGDAINLKLTNNGTHTILVHDLIYAAAANYALSLQSVTGGGCNSRAIPCGQTVSTNTTFKSQMDAFSYAGSAGQVLAVALWGPINCFNGGQAMVADVYNPNGQLMASLRWTPKTGPLVKMDFRRSAGEKADDESQTQTA